MKEKTQKGASKIITEETATNSTASLERRAALKKIGRFAAVSAPTVTLLLAATVKPKKAMAASGFSSRQFKNPEGAADGLALMATLSGSGSGVALDMIDGIGICLAAIKELAAKVGTIETQVRAAQ